MLPLCLLIAWTSLVGAGLDGPLQPPRWTGLSPDKQALIWVEAGSVSDVVGWKPLSDPASPRRDLWRADGWIEGIHWRGQELLIRTRQEQRVRWYQVQWPGGGQKLLLTERVTQRHGPQLLRVLDDGQVVFSNDRRQPWQPDLFRLDVAGKITRVERNTGKLFRWHPAPDGQVLLARRWRGDAHGPLYEWLWRSARDQPWEAIRQRRLNQEPWRLLGFSADSERARLGSETTAGQLSLNLNNGSLSDEPAARVHEPGAQSIPKVVSYRRPESTGALDETSVADLLVLGQRARSRPLFWLGKSAIGSVWQTGPDAAGLQILTVDGSRVQRWDGVSLAAGHKVSAHRVDSRDGQSIEVLVTAPGIRPKGIVLLIHGGPWSHDKIGWHGEAQWLAGLGYGVLQVNFRGSTNQGTQWQWAGRRQWSGKMLDDLEDAIAWARQRQMPGSNRLCAMGSSFGGYAALMLAAREAPLIRCTVARAAVSDVAAQIQYLDEVGNQRGYWEWREMVGDPQDPGLALASPLRIADKIRGPVMLGHGENDDVVDIAQSRRMLESLRTARSMQADRAAVHWVLLKDQGHDLLGAAARQAWYSQVSRFLDRALADDG